MADEPLIEPAEEPKTEPQEDVFLDAEIMAKLENIEKRGDERWTRLMEKLESLERAKPAPLTEEPPSEAAEEPVTVIEVETPPEPTRRRSRGWW